MRPRQPTPGIARAERHRPAEQKQPAREGCQRVRRRKRFDLLGGDMADIAERGAAARIARIDQRDLETRGTEPQAPTAAPTTPPPITR